MTSYTIQIGSDDNNSLFVEDVEADLAELLEGEADVDVDDGDEWTSPAASVNGACELQLVVDCAAVAPEARIAAAEKMLPRSITLEQDNVEVSWYRGDIAPNGVVAWQAC